MSRKLENFIKGYKTKTIGGIKKYAEGPHAGKQVGTVRGKGEKKEKKNKKRAWKRIDKISRRMSAIKEEEKSYKDYIGLKFYDNTIMNIYNRAIDSINLEMIQLETQMVKIANKNNISIKGLIDMSIKRK